VSPEHHRSDRVAAAMREEIATFLANDVKDPRIVGLVTVTAVEVTRDLRHAKVFVSVLGSDAQRAATFEGLAAVAPHLRGRVGRALRLRAAPEIEFRNDESIAHAARIEQLLAQVRGENASAPSDDPLPPPGDEGRDGG
jgi:ribosome-binding factor A